MRSVDGMLEVDGTRWHSDIAEVCVELMGLVGEFIIGDDRQNLWVPTQKQVAGHSGKP